MVFDITSESTFTNLENWLYELKNHSHQKICITLVGNKRDLSAEREVSYERANEFVKKHNLDYYFETSAATGENVEKVFFDLGADILGRIEKGVINVALDTAYGVKMGGKNKNKKYPSQGIGLAR